MAERQAAVTGERQLVVFQLASEVYGVDINGVREIIRMQEITQVPNAPEFIEGVINLRGKICPVMDLRKRFGVTAADVTADSRIVVVEVGGDDVGMIVDAVTEVLRVTEGRISPPTGVSGGNADVVEGIVNLDDRLIILVNLEHALTEGAADRVGDLVEA